LKEEKDRCKTTIALARYLSDTKLEKQQAMHEREMAVLERNHSKEVVASVERARKEGRKEAKHEFDKLQKEVCDADSKCLSYKKESDHFEEKVGHLNIQLVNENENERLCIEKDRNTTSKHVAKAEAQSRVIARRDQM